MITFLKNIYFFFLKCQKVYRRILHAYESDFEKYSEHVQHKFLQMIFLKALTLIGQILKYTNIDKETRSRDLKPAINLLSSAGLIQMVCNYSQWSSVARSFSRTSI